MTRAVRIGIVGSGWRADFYARLATVLSDRLELVGAAVRRPESAEHVTRQWGVPAHLGIDDLMRSGRPDLVVVAVPRTVAPEVLGVLVEGGVRVLAETPPAGDQATLFALWQQIGRANLVHVAEQYPSMPAHRARHALVRQGVIGTPTSVHVSSTHDYHAIALMRCMLGVGLGAARVRTDAFTAPLVNPIDRGGWTYDAQPHPARTLLSTIDFGDASGLYDFTDNQWHNRLRHRRILIRGSRGEIADDSVLRLADERTVLTSTLVRSQLGQDLNLDGFDTEHLAIDGEVLYRNPFLGHRLSDEEVAIATVLCDAAAWAQDASTGPYPLAQACHDQLIALAMHRSADTGGAAVTTEAPPWITRAPEPEPSTSRLNSNQ